MDPGLNSAWPIFVFDLDSDGDPDIITSGGEGRSIAASDLVWYENQAVK